MALPDSIDPRPSDTTALIGDEGVTVAHRWIAGCD
jgi:hypothetical protein